MHHSCRCVGRVLEIIYKKKCNWISIPFTSQPHYAAFWKDTVTEKAPSFAARERVEAKAAVPSRGLDRGLSEPDRRWRVGFKSPQHLGCGQRLCHLCWWKPPLPSPAMGSAVLLRQSQAISGPAWPKSVRDDVQEMRVTEDHPHTSATIPSRKTHRTLSIGPEKAIKLALSPCTAECTVRLVRQVHSKLATYLHSHMAPSDAA